jgi:N-acetylornithine carbamoyltransferase
MIATKYGMNVTLLCPTPDYVLDERFMKAARRNCEASGSRLTVSHEFDEGYGGADVVYAASWGALPYYGDSEKQWSLSSAYRRLSWTGKRWALTRNALLSHCLPVRRNVEVTDAVIDSGSWIAIDEAENRLHVQKALMLSLLENRGS